MTTPTPYQTDRDFDSDVLEEDEREILTIADEDDDEMPTMIHGELQLMLLRLLMQCLKAEFRVLPPVTFQGVGRKFTPDVVVYPKDYRQVPESSLVLEPPLLAVEIISPGQTMRDMVNKCQGMVASGVEECWIVEPANETVTVCTAERRFALHAGEMLTYHRLQTPLRVDDVFAVESL